MDNVIFKDALDINTRMKLNNGVEIPMLGLGVWQIPDGKPVIDAVSWALKEGYRHIDTARAYENETGVGQAIKKSRIPREEIFVTTKLWNSDHDDPEAALNASLKRLGLDYVDLYLIHWPVPERNESWKVLEKLYRQGLAKAIGVSNFTNKHIDQLLKIASVVPAVNQIEFSPFLYQKEVQQYFEKKGIYIEAYSPLTRGERLNDPKIKKIADQYAKTPAQLMLRWGLQHGLIILPKSSDKDRIRQNAQIYDFNINEMHMKELDSLDEGKHYCWDPGKVE